MSTHILSEIEAVCNRVVVLIDGELAADAPLDELLSAQEVNITFAEAIPEQASTQLCTIEGVSPEDIETISADNTLKVRCTHAAQIAREAMKQARTHHWDVQSLAPTTPSLENVFRSLMYAHAERKASGENAA